MRKFTIITISIFIIPFLFLTSCASILNSKYQKVTIEHPEGSQVLVDGYTPQKKGEKFLLRRDADAKGIIIKKEGFKDEHIAIIQNHKSPLYIASVVPFTVLFFIPPFYDNLLKSRNYPYQTSLKNEMTPLPNKSTFNEKIIVKTPHCNISSDSVEIIDFLLYNRYLKGKSEPKKLVKGDKDQIDFIQKVDPNSLLINNLSINNYVSPHSSKEIQISANVSKINTKYIDSYRNQTWTTYPSFGTMVVNQVGIEWSYVSKEGVLIQHYTYSPSGEFALIGNKTSRDSIINQSIMDATETGFIQFVNSSQFQAELLKYNTNQVVEQNTPAIELNAPKLEVLKNQIRVEKNGFDVYLIKNDTRIKISKELSMTKMNSKLVLDFIEDHPELYLFAKINMHKGHGFISSLISCYNDLQQNPLQNFDQTYYHRFGLVTKKEWKHGPTSEMLAEKKYLSGEIFQFIVTTQHYDNNIATTSTTGDNFKFSFYYGNAEFKKGFLMTNLQKVVKNDPEAMKYVREYQRKKTIRGAFTALGVTIVGCALSIASGSDLFNLSEDATPFIAIPGVLLASIPNVSDHTYKSKCAYNAIITYNKNLSLELNH